MKKKNNSSEITDIFFNFFGNMLRTWHNYDMFILLFTFIGLVFVIILNLHLFKPLFSSLFIWCYFPKKLVAFLFHVRLRSFSWCGPLFFALLMSLFFEGLCELLVVTSTAITAIIVFLLSNDNSAIIKILYKVDAGLDHPALHHMG